MFTANHLLRPLFNGRLLKDALKIKQIVLACYKDTTEVSKCAFCLFYVLIKSLFKDE